MLWLDPSTSGRILENFKTEERQVLFENKPVDTSSINDLYEKEYLISGLEGLKLRLDATQKIYQEKKEEMTWQRKTLEEAIDAIETGIATTAKDIRDTEDDLKERNKKIDQYETNLILLANQIRRNRAIILSYLANIYSQTNLIYNEENHVDILQGLILTDGSTDAVSQDITYKSLVSVLGQKFIDDFRALTREYYILQTRMKEEAIHLDELRQNLDRKKEILISQKDYREKLLADTQWKEELYQWYVHAQMEMKAKVENSWKDANNAYITSIEWLLEKNGCKKSEKNVLQMEKCANILTFFRNERDLTRADFGTGVNVLAWPVDPTGGISAYYKDPYYYAIAGSQHEAIDIPVNQGTPVRAAADGYVYYILPPVSGGYSYMAVKHPQWYYTVYGHLSDVIVSPYQYVKKGDVIARSGWTPGTPGAGPITSGAHLHFEVFKDKQSLDPLRVLDTSILEYTSLPSRYQDKFISDIITHSGPTVDTSEYARTFVIKWNTEEERQKYLLKTYASREFQNWDIWVDTALDANIDPSFLMCVWLAETTLGNYLKTPYNVWNVWNTDSGDVVSFGSVRQGIAAMASTFNNRYLREYNTVDELSRWGNENGAIYASSNANWHNNIIKCVSSIQGRFVEDNYRFRRE